MIVIQHSIQPQRTDTRASVEESGRFALFSGRMLPRYINNPLAVPPFEAPAHRRRSMKEKSVMVYVVWGLVLLLIILHQDNWNWEKTDLVLGFIPIGLAWHAGISIAASCVWYLATLVAWPKDPNPAESLDPQEAAR